MTESTEFAKRIKRDDVEIFELHKKEGQDLSIYPKMIRIFRKIKPDIVHSKNFGAIEAQLAALFAGVKFRVHSEHGRDFDDIDGTNIKRNLVRRLILLSAQKCIPLSKNLESWLVNTVKIPPKKVVQLYNGVDTNKFDISLSKPQLCGAPSSWQSRIIIGTVGRLQAVKDQKTLLLGFINLVTQKPALKKQLGLVIVGDGAERTKLEKIAAAENVESCVWFAGSRNDVKDVLNYLDIFVLPSLNEGISNTILEAMASGLPVIATRVGGNPELVEEGSTGLLVPPNNPKQMSNALEAYVSDRSLAKKHGRTGRERVETLFSLDKMVQSYLQIYDSLLMQ